MLETGTNLEFEIQSEEAAFDYQMKHLNPPASQLPPAENQLPNNIKRNFNQKCENVRDGIKGEREAQRQHRRVRACS